MRIRAAFGSATSIQITVSAIYLAAVETNALITASVRARHSRTQFAVGKDTVSALFQHSARKDPA
jgi:hypothetical protein